MLIEIEESGGWLNTFLMKDNEGNINYKAVLIVYAIPVFTFIGVCTICIKGDSTEEEQKPKQTGNQKKDKKKTK